MVAINLIHPSVVRRRVCARRIRGWVLAGVVTAGLGAFPVGLELSRHKQALSLQNERSGVVQRVAATRAELTTIGAEIRSLSSQISRAEALRAKRPWASLLALLSNALPQELWLSSLATDPPAPSDGFKDLVPPEPAKGADEPAEPTVVTFQAPRALVFEGYAVDHRHLYEFMARLKETGVFHTVSLTKASEEPVLGAKALRFYMKCEW